MEEFSLYNPKSPIGKRFGKHRSTRSMMEKVTFHGVTRTPHDVKSSQETSPELTRTSRSTNKCTYVNQEMENMTSKSHNTEIEKMAKLSNDDKLFNVGSSNSKMKQTTLTDCTRTLHDNKSSRLKIEKRTSTDTGRTPHDTESRTHRSSRLKMEKGTSPDTARTSHDTKSSTYRSSRLKIEKGRSPDAGRTPHDTESSTHRSSRLEIEKSTSPDTGRNPHDTESSTHRSSRLKMEKRTSPDTARTSHDTESKTYRSSRLKIEKGTSPDTGRTPHDTEFSTHRISRIKIEKGISPDTARTSHDTESSTHRSSRLKMEKRTSPDTTRTPYDSKSSKARYFKSSKDRSSNSTMEKTTFHGTKSGNDRSAISKMDEMTSSDKARPYYRVQSGRFANYKMETKTLPSIARTSSNNKSCKHRYVKSTIDKTKLPDMEASKYTNRRSGSLKMEEFTLHNPRSSPGTTPNNHRSRIFRRTHSKPNTSHLTVPLFSHRDQLAAYLEPIVGPCRPVIGNAVDTKPRNQRKNKGSMCPVPGCGYKTNSLKRHVLTLHLPSFFRVPCGRLACPCPEVISKRVLALRSVARAIPGVGENLWTLLNRVNSDHLIPLDSRVDPQTYIVYKELARQLGWVPITNFSLNPLCHIALLTHWRVFASILGYVSQRERHALLNRFF
ncbi:hypothetical protein SNE40_017567 [Patella caerulea]|uniref:Uncharacterized protein n=1 Tax=Patella caerulea TaxID=87958 RepID=A0AAN8PQ56_PATCE